MIGEMILNNCIGNETKQYDEFTNKAYNFSNQHENKEITFVGHSLGGGLAAAAALKTGNSAITFNPAALALSTKERYGLNQDANITNYQVLGEILGVQSLFGMKYEGKVVELSPSIGQCFKTAIYLHTMGAMIPILKKEYPNAQK